MSPQLTERLASALSDRYKRGLVRSLRAPNPTAHDFSSNDYLGLARSKQFTDFLNDFLNDFLFNNHQVLPSGSTGSRLLTGHSQLTSRLEEIAACFHHADQALLFNSGYDANLSLLSCIPGPEDVIVYDEFIHASVHDGMRMSRAREQVFPFSHNDLTSLQHVITTAINQHSGSVIVCVETVYSMDGDVAPLRGILSLCSSLQLSTGREIHVIADEAHAAGLYGPHGEGIIVASQLQFHHNLLARIVTFGKAFALHGAVALARSHIVTYILNYARPLIYSTALPPSSVASLCAAYGFAITPYATIARKAMWANVHHFRKLLVSRLPHGALLPHDSTSPIQAIRVEGNQNCVHVAHQLRCRGFDVYPIRSPTVPPRTERIRVILHAHNTCEQIDRFIDAVLEVLHSLKLKSRKSRL